MPAPTINPVVTGSAPNQQTSLDSFATQINAALSQLWDRAGVALEMLPVTPFDFGAVGDGVADDRAAFLAMDAVGGEAFIVKPPVAYRFSSPLKLTNVSVEFDSSATWAQLTGNGALTCGYENGFRDQGFAAVHRAPGRAFFGGESAHSGNIAGANGYGDTPIATGIASYFIKNAAMGVSHESRRGRIGLVGASWVRPGEPGASSIGVAGVARMDGTSGSARGLYGEVIAGAFVVGAASTAGEFQVGNHTGVMPVVSAYNMGLSITNGMQIAAESQHLYTRGDGDVPYPAPTMPAGAGIDISGGSISAAYQKFLAGIVFRNGAMVLDASGNGNAILMARRHRIKWECAQGLDGAMISSVVEDGPGRDQRIIFVNGGWEHRNQSGLAIHTFTADDTARNGLRIQASNPGTGPFFRAQGPDDDIDLNFRPKNGGVMSFGDFLANIDAAIIGHILIKDETGIPRKLAVIA